MRCVWPVLVLIDRTYAASSAPCRDNRLSGLDGLDGATSAAPTFMVAPMQALCKEAALTAARDLGPECSALAEMLSHEEYQTCEKLGAVLLSASSVTSCFCKAAELIADADEDLTASILATGPPGKHHAALASQSAARATPALPVLVAAFCAATAFAVAARSALQRWRSCEAPFALDIL